MHFPHRPAALRSPREPFPAQHRRRPGLRGDGDQPPTPPPKAREFVHLKPFLTVARSEISYAQAAAAAGLSEGAARVAVHRLRRRYRELFREEIARTVADPAEVDAELRHLHRRPCRAMILYLYNLPALQGRPMIAQGKAQRRPGFASSKKFPSPARAALSILHLSFSIYNLLFILPPLAFSLPLPSRPRKNPLCRAKQPSHHTRYASDCSTGAA